MNDLDHKEPDYYVENNGVEVEREVRFPESGQVAIRINHNKFQSTRLQIGLEQAQELHAKLGVLIAQITGENAAA